MDQNLVFSYFSPMELRDLCQVKDLLATVVQLEARIRLETGLNLNQAFGLCCLAKGPLTATELAERLRVPPASLSRIIKSLVEAGLVDQEIHKPDSRKRLFSLTSRAEALTERLLEGEARWFPVKVQENSLGNENLPLSPL